MRKMLRTAGFFVGCSLLLTTLGCERPRLVLSAPQPRMDLAQPSSPPPPVSTTNCPYDGPQLAWLMTSAGLGVLAGAGGISTIPATDATVKDALGGTSLAVGVFSAIAAVAVNYYNNKVITNCQPAPTP